MRTVSGFAAILAVSMATSSATAQKAPNFTGTWVLAVDKSDFGAMPAPQSRTDVIEHNEPGLTIKRTAATPNGPINLTLVYAVDGKPHKNTTPQGEITSSLKWEGQVLVIESTLDTPNGPAAITDRMSLSADGKTLTQKRAISIQGQDLAQTMILVKQ
jgi:hypothetical protein